MVAGTEANLHAAVTAAIAALGPAHGGAPSRVLHMIEEVERTGNAEGYVRDLLDRGDRLMGFGHRVYRAEDPRARHMRAGVEQLSRQMGQPQWYQILEALVTAMKPYARHGVNVNVDFYAGVVYFLNGIAEDLFVPIFAVGRVPGWAVQVLEQMENNILIRPLLCTTVTSHVLTCPSTSEQAQDWARTITTVATMSSTLAPRDGSLKGRAKPCSTGPMACAPPRY